MVRILVISDMHVGSAYGLMPEEAITYMGNEIRANTGQKYLLDCWEQMKKDVKNYDIVVLNGDIVDGTQSKTLGFESVITDWEFQGDMAFMLLEDIVKKADKTFLVRGSEYHELIGAKALEYLGEKLKNYVYDYGKGQKSAWALNLQVEKRILNFAHYISVAQGFYRATPLDREGIFSRLAEKKLGDADVVVRSHAHIFCHLEHSSKHIVVTPCWELPSSYIKRSVYRFLPEIGVVVIEVDDVINIEKHLYPLPKIEKIGIIESVKWEKKKVEKK